MLCDGGFEQEGNIFKLGELQWKYIACLNHGQSLEIEEETEKISEIWVKGKGNFSY